MKTLKFNTTKPQSFRDMGGDHVAVAVGRCAQCRRRVFQQYDVDLTLTEEQRAVALGKLYEPDPRGAIDPLHAACSMVAEEHDFTGPDALFCWDCVNEHGGAGYQACLSIAKRQWESVAVSV